MVDVDGTLPGGLLYPSHELPTELKRPNTTSSYIPLSSSECPTCAERRKQHQRTSVLVLAVTVDTNLPGLNGNQTARCKFNGNPDYYLIYRGVSGRFLFVFLLLLLLWYHGRPNFLCQLVVGHPTLTRTASNPAGRWS